LIAFKKCIIKNILHNDLNKAIDSNERPNIVISENRLRLIDCEKMITDKNHVDWDKFYDKELKNINEYFSELVDFKCNTLT
jgi:RIO-like serine/threonine protein kinase